ncbi:MAG: cyclic di-GMP phosphodiesterase [Verrucomicrobiota bacterium]
MQDFDNSSMTILVADDQEPNRELLSALLTAEGYQVICAEDGDQALSLIRSQEIDLALLDVVMPRRTGFTVCQITKSDPETRMIPIVLVTGLNRPDDRVDGAVCGADDFLSKPVNKRELLARVHSLLRLKQYTDELDNAETVLFSLALSIEAKDPYTGGHCDRLSNYSMKVAERLRLPEDLRVALSRCSYPRYRQASRARAYPAQTWTTDCGRANNHAAAQHNGRANLLPT